MNTVTDEFDDVGEGLRQNRPLKAARAFRILFALENLDFRQVSVSDPVPTGRQILAGAGLDEREDFSLFAILASGDFEDVRLDEPFDLRGRGAERFVAFRTDRDFKLTLDGRQLTWGKPVISGAVLYTLAGVGVDLAIFLEVPGGEDCLVEMTDVLDLSESGIEHFITAPKPASGYDIIVNARKETVPEKRVTFEQVVRLAFPGAPAETNVQYSMTYRNAASKPHDGELGEGGSVEVKKQGTIFNVYKTVKS